MKLVLKPVLAKTSGTQQAKPEISGPIEHLLKTFADRLPPSPKPSR